MKLFTKILGSVLAVCMSFNSYAQDANNSEDESIADQFSLQGALELFKQSTSPENFEQLLNKPGNAVNNLDINQDGKVDYVRVIDKKKDNFHAMVLQVPVDVNESQDVAVIEIEKTGKDQATLQIIGDETIYGKELIVEPADEQPEEDAFIQEDYPNGPYSSVADYSTRRIFVNVWLWPSVRFIFRPDYDVWISPCSWDRWPAWYDPWEPWPYYQLRPMRIHYYPRYIIVPTHRLVHVNQYYRPYRQSSVYVSRNYGGRNYYRRNDYNRGSQRGYERVYRGRNHEDDHNNGGRVYRGGNNEYRNDRGSRGYDTQIDNSRVNRPDGNSRNNRQYRVEGNPGRSERLERSSNRQPRIERNNDRQPGVERSQQSNRIERSYDRQRGVGGSSRNERSSQVQGSRPNRR